MVSTRRAFEVAVAALVGGCAPLATAPAWTGGGMAVTGPVGVPRIEPAGAAGPSGDENEETMGARHVLVMHIDSQARPEHVVRTREQARARATEALEKLRAGAAFSDIVDAYSDEPGAAERGGDLGLFGRNAMVKPFSDAAFALQVGQLSDVVETRYGFHLIQRTR